MKSYRPRLRVPLTIRCNVWPRPHLALYRFPDPNCPECNGPVPLTVTHPWLCLPAKPLVSIPWRYRRQGTRPTLNDRLARVRLTIHYDVWPRPHIGLYRLPNPDCPTCGGEGGYYDGHEEDGWWEDCPCLPDKPVISIPWPRRRISNVCYSQEPPF
ncbi:hypothetical protein ACWCYY_10930 [Kitasatospora sp. NPDC001664]